MSKYSLVKYYQNNKEWSQKKVRDRYQSFYKEEKTTIWLSKIQKSTRRWKTKAFWV